MFGNRLGWGISFVIVLCSALLANLMYQTAQPSPATGWAAKAIVPIDSLGGADQVIADATVDRDAAEFYRQAIDDYRANSAVYDALATARTLTPAVVAARPGVKLLLNATRCRSMDLFRSDPQAVITYDREKEPLIALDQVAHTAMQVALRTDPPTATACYASIFSLGTKLYRERVIYGEMATGEELMGIGCKGLKSLAHRANDAARERMLDQFDSQRLAANAEQIQPVWSILGNIDMNVISAYAGDWFQLARDKSIDPLWQVEATLKLGQLKYSAARLGDQKSAQRELQKLAEDQNQSAAVRAAAAVGRDLTIEQYRTLH